MRLVRLELENFRNIEKAVLEFEGERHFFLGPNGQGKTNVLEAIAYANGLESFRTKKREPLVMSGKPEAIIRSHWEHEKQKTTVLGVSIAGEKRKAVLDGAAVRKVSEISGLFPVVALSLADQELLYGGHQARREEIDRLICQMDPGYHQVLHDNEKAVRERNQLLQAPDAKPSEFEAFESVMAACARRLVKSRERATGLLREKFKSTFASFSPGSESPGLFYEPNANPDELPALWKELRATKDKALGCTTKGPQRDHFSITFNRQPAELYASEGQKFSLVLALKLAGLELLREKLQIAPVLACDDLLLELDSVRQKLFWESVKGLQVFASGTVPPSSPGWKIWNVEKGEITS